jgi:uncharacterized membrane protein YeiH
LNSIQAIGMHTLTGLELIGTAAFAISGVLGAVRKKMDVVGMVVCGFLAAFGGGTLRDVLLDRRPFFWVEHQSVLIGVLLLCIACGTFFHRLDLKSGEKWLQIPDAIGLGLFSATGLHLSWTVGQPPAVAIMMGVITATFGGVLRDLICNEIPSLFKDHRPYAICALAGGVSYALAIGSGAPPWSAVAVCATVTTGSRLFTLWRNLTLPSVHPD